MNQENSGNMNPIVAGPPATLEETGVPLTLIVELACKTLYYGGVLSLSAVSAQLALPVSVSKDAMDFLKKERLAEVKQGSDVLASTTYALTDLGRERAREYLRFSGYVGAVPVPLDRYTEAARRQSVRKMAVDRESVQRAFEEVVLPPGLLERLGPAINSGRSIFLYGPTGNGKTFIAERLAKVLTGTVFIPHAIAVDNQVVRVFDPVNHVRIEHAPQPDPTRAFPEEPNGIDRRWVACERPVIVAGGELTLAMLDLSVDPSSNSYEAPLQLKANGGVFLIDDLGRQLVQPFALLNRWIVPLERSLDYLTLRNGKKFAIPFDQIVLFSTNIEPRQLADEAFLRRIGYKIKVDYAREEEYIRIFRQVCDRLGFDCPPEAVRYLLDEELGMRRIRLSACQPGDLMSRIAEICRYEGIPARVEIDLLRRACRDYFMEL
ncbi:MAG: ATPase [Deltaproteobacteria bacterium]|nr:ATPase [Deltaproteobacteria bacterium]